MSFWNEYAADAEKETLGIWTDFKGGLRLRIARADADANPAFAKAYQEVMAETDDNNQAELDQAAIDIHAVLVTDAQGLTDQHGDPMECTEQNIAAVFSALPELYKQVRAVAYSFDNYRLDQAVSQLGKSSSGNSNMGKKKNG